MANRTWAVDETNRTPQARRHKQNVIRIQINKASRIQKDAEVESSSHTSTHDPLGPRNWNKCHSAGRAYKFFTKYIGHRCNWKCNCKCNGCFLVGGGSAGGAPLPAWVGAVRGSKGPWNGQLGHCLGAGAQLPAHGQHLNAKQAWPAVDVTPQSHTRKKVSHKGTKKIYFQSFTHSGTV